MDLIRKSHTVVPFLLAVIAAGHDFGLQLTEGFHVAYKATTRSVGFVTLAPWLNRSMGAIARSVSAASNWMLMLLQLRAPAVCALAMILALLVADLSASHLVIATAIVVPVATITSVEQLRTERASLLREAEALSGADSRFDTDAARAAGDQARSQFDAKMGRIREIDVRISELEKAPVTQAAPAPAVDVNAIRAEERKRITDIREAVRLAGLPTKDGDDMIARGITVDVARGEIFQRMAAKDDANPTRTPISLSEDEKEKFARGAQAWLLQRSGLSAMVAKFEKAEKIAEPGEFRGMTLLEMARMCLERAGVNTRGMDRMSIAGQAMSRSNYQTPSDFTVLLENTMHKVLRAAYGITPDTWSRFCATGTTSDFRTHNWYRTGALSELDSLTDTGEFKNKAIPDGEKATYSVGTKGNIIAVSRQTIVNDDLGAVMQLTQRLGRAGKLTIEKMVYALLAQNSNLGPTYGAAPLFDDLAHGNVSTGAALSAANIDADRVKMAQQKEPNSNEYADLRPAILLVPVSLGGTARIINTSQYDPDTLANKAQMKPNVVAGLFRDVVDTPRLSGTRRYLFADPDIAPVIMVSFLEGQQEPVLETEQGWRVDGVEMKARLDVGVDAVDFRGAVTNAGQ